MNRLNLSPFTDPDISTNEPQTQVDAVNLRLHQSSNSNLKDLKRNENYHFQELSKSQNSSGEIDLSNSREAEALSLPMNPNQPECR